MNGEEFLSKLNTDNLSKEELVELMAFIGAVPESIEPWFSRPNDAFDGLTPNQVLEEGNSNLVRNMIYDIAFGNPM